MSSPVGQFIDSTQGRTSTNPFITVIFPRPPSPSDGINNVYKIGQRWVDSVTNTEYFLKNFSAFNGALTANWIEFIGSSAGVFTLTGNDSVVVNPLAGNINVLGDVASGVAVTGSPNTETITLANIPNSSLLHDSITMIGGLGITITGSPVALGGSVTITASGTGITWVDVTTPTQLLAANMGYVIDHSIGLVTLTLPALAALGDTYIIAGMSMGGWQVNVGAGQTIQLGSSATTISTGSIASTNQWDSVTINCVFPNTVFACRSVIGNLTVV